MTKVTSLTTGFTRHAGFTLLELLVVTVILAIVASTLMLSAGLAGPQAKASNARQALVYLVNQHCDEAVLLGREGGVRMAPDGYDFHWWDGEQWQAREEKLFVPRLLEPPLELELTWNEALNEDADLPQIVCDSSGEITPFSASLVIDDARFMVTVDDDGRLAAVDADNDR
ncbi:MAG: type II secretion system minor pseudopilin GspH [Lysobacterales bacterium]